MTKGVPKKRQRAEQLRKKCAQAASAPVTGAKKSPKAIPVPGRATAMSGPLPPSHYPAKRVAIGKRQVAGGGA
jgi:hypothetical protein